ncbi:MAG: D-aminoacyl-tRNA deacylase [Acidobacteriota bacterium]
MRAVIQRVSEASVRIEGRTVSRIGPGLLVLIGIARDDASDEIDRLAGRLPTLRLFDDGERRLNRSVEDIGGEILVVSQFTLMASLDRGRRPGLSQAAPPQEARRFYDRFVSVLSRGTVPVRTGVFGAMMEVSLVNDGPVTFVADRSRRARHDG